MNQKLLLVMLTLSALLANHGSAHAQVAILFDYTYDGGFFSGANVGRRATLEAAATSLTSRVTDTFNAITPSGINHWSRDFTSPSDSSTVSVADPIIPANTLVFYVGGKDLGWDPQSSSTLGTATPGGASANGTGSWYDSIITRGVAGITRMSGTLGGSPTDTDYAPWGGVVTFNSAAPWYFDADPSTTESLAGLNDFYSVALHEITHVLGIGQAPSWNNKVNVSGDFTGSSSVQTYGGEVPLNGGQDHWAEGTMSIVSGTGVIQEALMDPSLTIGTRKYITDLDLVGLEDIGWEVSAVPEPTTVGLVTAFALLGVGVYHRRVRSRSVRG